MTDGGETLETVRIVNDRDRLAAVMARAGERPEVVLEATYGWYWAADELAELGAQVHLAGVPQLVGRFGLDRYRLGRSAPCRCRPEPKSCRHTTGSFRLDWAA